MNIKSGKSATSPMTHHEFMKGLDYSIKEKLRNKLYSEVITSICAHWKEMKYYRSNASIFHKPCNCCTNDFVVAFMASSVGSMGPTNINLAPCDGGSGIPLHFPHADLQISWKPPITPPLVKFLITWRFHQPHFIDSSQYICAINTGTCAMDMEAHTVRWNKFVHADEGWDGPKEFKPEKVNPCPHCGSVFCGGSVTVIQHV